MEVNFQKINSVEPISLLLVGNNPIELGVILGKIQRAAEKNIITEIAFDLKSIFERLIHFKPNFILIDDNIGKHKLNEAIYALSQNRRTRDIPVTVLKNSNYTDSMGGSSILDYALKQNLSAESLLNALRNSIKLRRTQMFLHKAYSLRKKKLMNLLQS